MFIQQLLLTSTVALANVLGVGMLIPQALRIIGTRSLKGVSGAWIGAGIAINTGWFIYGLAVGVVGLLPVSAGSLVLYVWIFTLASSISRGTAREAAMTAGAILSLLTLVLGVGDVATFGLVLSACYTVQFAPAAREALQSRDVDSISPSTWIMATTEALLWAGYGIAIADLPVALGGIGATFMSAIVLGQLKRAPRRRLRRRIAL